VIETFTPDRTDEPFGDPILPGRTGRNRSIADTHGSAPLADDIPIQAVTVAEQILWCLLPGKGIGDLLGNPFGSRMGSDCKRHDPPAIVSDDYKGIEQNPIVGTTKRSIAATPAGWLRRKVFQLWLGGRCTRAMYLATVDCAILMPSIITSP
jgi:hypothetical protein